MHVKTWTQFTITEMWNRKHCYQLYSRAVQGLNPKGHCQLLGGWFDFLQRAGGSHEGFAGRGAGRGGRNTGCGKHINLTESQLPHNKDKQFGCEEQVDHPKQCCQNSAPGHSKSCLLKVAKTQTTIGMLSSDTVVKEAPYLTCSGSVFKS